MLRNRDCGTKMDKYEKFDKYSMNSTGTEYMMAMPDANYQMDMGCSVPTPGMVCPPVYECPQERVCHRYICHEVPHICPCNTRVINHHVYRHSFTPCYSCCEENVISNIYDNCCGGF